MLEEKTSEQNQSEFLEFGLEVVKFILQRYRIKLKEQDKNFFLFKLNRRSLPPYIEYILELTAKENSPRAVALLMTMDAEKSYNQVPSLKNLCITSLISGNASPKSIKELKMPEELQAMFDSEMVTFFNSKKETIYQTVLALIKKFPDLMNTITKDISTLANAIALCDSDHFDYAFRLISTTFGNEIVLKHFIEKVFIRCFMVNNLKLPIHLINGYYEQLNFSLMTQDAFLNTPLHYLASHSIANQNLPEKSCTTLSDIQLQGKLNVCSVSKDFFKKVLLEKSHYSNLLQFLAIEGFNELRNDEALTPFLCAVKYGDLSTIKLLSEKSMLLSEKKGKSFFFRDKNIFDLVQERAPNDTQKEEILMFLRSRKTNLPTIMKTNRVINGLCSIPVSIMALIFYFYRTYLNSYHQLQDQNSDLLAQAAINKEVLRYQRLDGYRHISSLLSLFLHSLSKRILCNDNEIYSECIDRVQAEARSRLSPDASQIVDSLEAYNKECQQLTESFNTTRNLLLIGILIFFILLACLKGELNSRQEKRTQFDPDENDGMDRRLKLE